MTTETKAEKYKRAESLTVALLLALTGGYLDIYSYLARGKVFANTQTGNLVLLGYNIAIGNGRKAGYYLLSICAFIIGIGVAKIIEHHFKEGKYFYWLHMSLAIEIVVLLVVMFIPEGAMNVIANVLVSFICALQVQSFRKVNGKAYSTIMFTGNLKNIGDQFTGFLITKDKEMLKSGMIYLGVTVTFVIGGWLGALTTLAYKQRAVGFVDGILVIVFILLYLEKRK